MWLFLHISNTPLGKKILSFYPDQLREDKIMELGHLSSVESKIVMCGLGGGLDEREPRSRCVAGVTPLPS